MFWQNLWCSLFCWNEDILAPSNLFLVCFSSTWQNSISDFLLFFLSYNAFYPLVHGIDSSIRYILWYSFQRTASSSLVLKNIQNRLGLWPVPSHHSVVSFWQYGRYFQMGWDPDYVLVRTPTLSPAVPDFALICYGSRSYKSSFPLGLTDLLNVLAKCSQIKFENFSALILPWYCSATVTPFP